jgi:pimeloyl-ACP methyl ester carboxylesterase
MTPRLIALAAAGAAVFSLAIAAAPAVAGGPAGVKNIVLVHGAWADGSGWRGIYDILIKDGYHVSIVQNPLTSLAEDVAAVHDVLARQDGPVILVGHSYGGAVITEAGVDPKVVGLVYTAAFMPDVGETVLGLLPKSDTPPPFEVSADGLAFLTKGAYLAAFAPDVGAELGAFMEASQAPLSAPKAGLVPLKAAAWKTKPSWYAVSADDQIIPPDLQRWMAKRAGSTVIEVRGSHVAFVKAQTAAIAKLIEQAATTVKLASN